MKTPYEILKDVAAAKTLDTSFPLTPRGIFEMRGALTVTHLALSRSAWEAFHKDPMFHQIVDIPTKEDVAQGVAAYMYGMSVITDAAFDDINIGNGTMAVVSVMGAVYEIRKYTVKA